MGNKLSDRENINNISACIDYINENSDNGKKHVIAKRNGKAIFNDEVTVNFKKTNLYYNVNIFWDDKISEESYHELGLNGYYSSMFYKMHYENKLLHISAGLIEIDIHE